MKSTSLNSAQEKKLSKFSLGKQTLTKEWQFS